MNPNPLAERAPLNRHLKTCLASLLLALACGHGPARAVAAQAAEALLHHRLAVTLKPSTQTIEVEDRLSLPAAWLGKDGLIFSLHPALRLEAHPAVEALSRSATLARYRLRLPAGQTQITLRYGGRLYNKTPAAGTVSTQGVFLSRQSHWFPTFGEELLSFDMRVHLPAGWRAISQGSGRFQQGQSHWREEHPQDDIYLVAGAYGLRQKTVSGIRVQLFTRDDDPELARRYFKASEKYLRLYKQLLGPYPYRKFAIVENFWETGFGMPSFTLLGPRVMRFPFILDSSLPHEILHNWWGNGVYVDYQRGNWAEGLTAYLADHLVQQRRGQGSDYRRSLLQKYRDYVSHQRDFPLAQFASRHDAASEAVGYGKGAMFFHMLRQQLGDELFFRGLRKFYRQWRFRSAGFDDLRAAWEEVSGRELDHEFEQWVQRRGAPQLRLGPVRQHRTEHAWQLDFELQQDQPGPAYRLRVPLRIQFVDERKPLHSNVLLEAPQQRFSLALPAAARLLQIDPEFDLFRRLHEAEIPPALSQGFGAEHVLVLLPRQAETSRLRAWLRLARQWRARSSGQWQILFDDEIQRLPSDRNIWLLGWNNRFRSTVLENLAGRLRVTAQGFILQGQAFQRDDHSLVVASRAQQAGAPTVLWVSAGPETAIAGLARKLPHYRKYSYLVFAGTAPDNRLKGQWPVSGGPLSHRFSP